MDLSRYLGTLKERNFRNLFLAHTTSVVGDDVATIALTFAVLSIEGTASALGLVLVARTVPVIVFSLVGGVWGDRMSRRALMVASDLLRAVAQGLTAMLLIAGTAEVWHLAVLQFFSGVGVAFFRPASTGLIPATVSPERLQQANALLSFSLSLSGIGGAALAGLLVTLVGPGWGMAVDAATYLASAAFLARLTLPPRDKQIAHESFMKELRAGWHEVRSRTWVWMSIASFMLFQLLVLPTFFILGPVLAERFSSGAARWSVIVASTGVGALLGDVLALRLEPRKPLRTTFLIGTLVAPAMILVGGSAPLPLLILAAIPFGVAFSFSNTLWFTTLQSHVPDHALARVSSYDWMGSTLLRPIGYLLVGPVAAALGASTTLIAAAIAITVVQVIVASTPSIGSIERRTSTETEVGEGIPKP